MARHEATHAVVAWLLDHPVRVVLIGPDAGETQPLDRTSPEDDLLIALAGVLGDPTAPPGMLCDRHVGDLVNIVRSAARICPDDPEPAIRKQALVVSNILSWRRVRRAIEAVARALVQATTLGPDEIDTIIGEAFARETTPRC